MKKTIVCLILAAFALVTAAQADDSKASAANKAATAEKAKASAQKPAPAEKGECCEKGGCSSKETLTKKAVKPVEKGATFLAKK
jgi:hypothetical protein